MLKRKLIRVSKKIVIASLLPLYLNDLSSTTKQVLRLLLLTFHQCQGEPDRAFANPHNSH